MSEDKEIEVSAPAHIEVVETEGAATKRTYRAGDKLPINWQIILLAAIAIIPPTLVAAAAWNQSKETHTLFNSRMTEMMILVKEAAASKAILEEKNAQRRREGSADARELEGVRKEEGKETPSVPK